MNHNDIREKLQLLIYGELEREEQKLVEAHLVGCPKCQRELDSLRELSSLLHMRPAAEIDDSILREARAELKVALRIERSRRGFLSKAGELIFPSARPGYKLALGSVGMLAAGVLIGRFLIFPFTPGGQANIAREAHRLQPASGQLQGETRITNLRFTETGGSEVDFTFDAVTPVRMKGGVDDTAVQKVLAHAMLNDLNPGVRLRAVTAMGQQNTLTSDREIKSALILSMKTDPNSGVRREALSALVRYKIDDEIKNAMIHTLMYDKNPGLRIAAINALDSVLVPSSTADRSWLDILREKERSDDNNYIRLKARAVLQEMKQQ